MILFFIFRFIFVRDGKIKVESTKQAKLTLADTLTVMLCPKGAFSVFLSFQFSTFIFFDNFIF